MVPLHFLSQLLTEAGSANLQCPSRIVCGAAALAIRRTSAPISAYSFSRPRHSSQSERCAAASREIGSPSNNAETLSAASAQFISRSSLRHREHARCVAALPVRQTISTSPYPPESGESPPAPRTIALQLRATTKATAVPQPSARMHLQSPKNLPCFQRVRPGPSRLDSPEYAPAFATIPRPAYARLRKDRRSTIPARVQTHWGVAKSA